MKITKFQATSSKKHNPITAGIFARSGDSQLYGRPNAIEEPIYHTIKTKPLSDKLFSRRVFELTVEILGGKTVSYVDVVKQLSLVSRELGEKFNNQIRVYRQGTHPGEMNFGGPWTVMPSTKDKPEIIATVQVLGAHQPIELKEMESLGEVTPYLFIRAPDGEPSFDNPYIPGIHIDPTTIQRSFDELDDEKIHSFFVESSIFNIMPDLYGGKRTMTIENHFKSDGGLFCATYHHTQ